MGAVPGWRLQLLNVGLEGRAATFAVDSQLCTRRTNIPVLQWVVKWSYESRFRNDPSIILSLHFES